MQYRHDSPSIIDYRTSFTHQSEFKMLDLNNNRIKRNTETLEMLVTHVYKNASTYNQIKLHGMLTLVCGC